MIQEFKRRLPAHHYTKGPSDALRVFVDLVVEPSSPSKHMRKHLRP